MIVTTTPSCSALKSLATDALLGNKGVSVDANAGKAETTDGVAQQANTAVAVGGTKKENYNAPIDTVVNEEGFKWWELMLIVLLAGWAIPSPSEIVRGVTTHIALLCKPKSETPQ